MPRNFILANKRTKLVGLELFGVFFNQVPVFGFGNLKTPFKMDVYRVNLGFQISRKVKSFSWFIVHRNLMCRKECKGSLKSLDRIFLHCSFFGQRWDRLLNLFFPPNHSSHAWGAFASIQIFKPGGLGWRFI